MLKSLRIAAISVLPLLAVAPLVEAQSAAPSPLATRLDSLARDFLSSAPAAGITAAVIRRQDTLLFSGYGERDREKHLTAGRATVYRVGSITKQFTASAILQHVQAGHLHLTDKIGDLLPQYPAWKEVTLRQLLTHTSGIHSYTASEAWSKRMDAALTPAEVMAFVASDTFDFRPGADWRYNNSGYFLLGMILEKLEAKPYADIVRDRFFTRLGMRSATYCPNMSTDTSFAVGYNKAGPSAVPAPRIDLSSPFSAGALCMSVPDFLTWQTALTSGKVVSPATYTLMTTSDTVAGKATEYGMGLARGVLPGHPLIQHGGDIMGFSAQQLWFPADSLRVVVFSNTLGSNPNRLAMNFARAVFGMPLVTKPSLPPFVALPAADRARYEGTYDLNLLNGAVLPLRVFAEGDDLMSQAEGQGKIPLRYLGNNTFGADFDVNVRLTFVVEHGKAIKLQLLQGGRTIEGSTRP